MTKEEFIEKVTTIHNGKYVYDKVEYKNTKVHIEIYCTVHNLYFSQTPEKHLLGRGCPICGKESSIKKKVTPFEQVIKQLQITRPEYDYSEIEYKNTITPVKVICPSHGVFETTIQKLLKCCYKCPSCVLQEREKKRLENEVDFIEKATELFNGKYNYDKVKYTKVKEKVEVICDIHGSFKITPQSHLRGIGCIHCGHLKSKEKRSFGIDKLKEKVIQKHKNIKIISSSMTSLKDLIRCECSEHGEFQTTGKNILRNSIACNECRSERLRNSLEEMKEKFKQLHGNRYNYSEVTYTGYNKRVKIICNEHGPYYMSPSDHLRGRGCQLCGRRSAGQKKTKTNEQFIEQAQKIHNNKYNYSQVEYINSSTKIKIICKEHGVFEQTPHNHLRGQGCPYCVGNVKYTTEYFKERAKKLYQNRYIYNEVFCNSYYDRIEVICKKHGTFKTIAGTFLTGRGCPKCKSSKGELEIIRLLEEKGISYEYQKKFNDLRDKQPLSYDFYIPSKNILVEYNGIQHYEPIDFWGGEESLRKQIYHDKLKKEYAESHNIKLIVISYKDDIKGVLQELIYEK